MAWPLPGASGVRRNAHRATQICQAQRGRDELGHAVLDGSVSLEEVVVAVDVEQKLDRGGVVK